MSTDYAYTNNIDLFNALELDSETDILLWIKHTDLAKPLKFIPRLYPDFKLKKRVIVLDNEIYSSWCKKFIKNNPNLHIFYPTAISTDDDQIHSYQYWFNRIKFAEQHNNYCTRIQNLDYKPYLFDALTGNNVRPHKQLVRKLITESKHIKNFLLGKPVAVCHANTNTNWILGCDEHAGCIKRSGSEDNSTQYNVLHKSFPSDDYCPLIDDVQYNIINQCWYSVVCETIAYTNRPFYTEKTARPLAAKRLFVAFAPRYHLKHLREFGFRTFNEVIDESYDNESNHEKRMHMAWQQVESLCTKDPNEVYKSIQHIVDHNQKVFFETDWTDQVRLQIKNII